MNVLGIIFLNFRKERRNYKEIVKLYTNNSTFKENVKLYKNNSTYKEIVK